MRNLMLVLIMALVCPVLAFAQDARALERALEAERAEDWDRAANLVRRADPVARDIIEWHRLRDEQGTAREVIEFLARRGDWPGLEWLRKQSEAEIARAGTDAILAFFADDLPQTGWGALAYIRALRVSGQDGAAQAMTALAWRTLKLEQGEQTEFLNEHGRFLRTHHDARMDMVLWEGWGDNARWMLPLVDDGMKRLAEARLALREDRNGVDARIAAVPDTLQNDPGLAWERFMWRARKGRRDDAMTLLMARSDSPASLGEPERWASWRRSYARAEMRAGNHTRAYAMASQNHLFEGSHYSDLEWLSGFIALRHLNNPDLALSHFERFRAAVFTPISLGRAFYWIGRAHEARGDQTAASVAYREGAKWQTSFYGLLAAERAGVPFDTALAARPVSGWRNAAVTRDDRFQAMRLLIDANQLNLAERFLRSLSDTRPVEDLPALGAALVAMDQPHLAVIAGKRAARRGVVIPAAYYPLHPLAEGAQPIPVEYSLAIARRESEFDPGVVSSAGARGLMQVMPATGRDAAKMLGISYEHRRVITDPLYNARLAKAYISDMAGRYGGNVVLVSIAYNAGPGRANRWQDQYGDPRRLRSEAAIVDWIEHIPFRETRNYVMRVAESLPIYRARLGLAPLPEPLSRELVGSSISPLSR